MTNHRTLGLREILVELFDLKYRGANIAAYARAQGLADGYMRAMLDLGFADERDLLACVNDERQKAAARAGLSSIRTPAPLAIMDCV